ncbi:NUDIX hydrolase [Desulforapulum autotrophicum]|uniref:NUDIX hydrolase n=1 Tax=Desulforapulum autotrophicum TaxID=2296 RepID=UPI0003115C12|nr:NUDIX hydrolase [Desulforapulum autotrophicum]
MDILALKKETNFTHLNLFSMRYRDTRDSEKSWIFASRSNNPQPCAGNTPVPDAVVVVPFHIEKQRLVIIREFRVPLGGYQYGFPAGLVDKGEKSVVAATRELWEETGLTLVNVLRQSPPVYSSSGMTDESVSLVYAECQGEPSTLANEASEDIEVIMLSKEDAASLLNTPDLKFDVKTWIILSTFATAGRI